MPHNGLMLRHVTPSMRIWSSMQLDNNKDWVVAITLLLNTSSTLEFFEPLMVKNSSFSIVQTSPRIRELTFFSIFGSNLKQSGCSSGSKGGILWFFE